MTKPTSIVLAQLDFCVGDLEGNASKILNACLTARDKDHADLILFPELALSGYPPEDLLLRQDFQNKIADTLQQLCEKITGIICIVGHPHQTEEGLFNAASIIANQKILATYHKQCLPNYGVFDENRYFTPGKTSTIFDLNGKKYGILICEDLWHPKPIQLAKQAGAEIILALNASPFDKAKPAWREKILQERTQESSLPIVYVNLVGGQDDLVFDGDSLVVNAQGKVVTRTKSFQEKLKTIQLDTLTSPTTHASTQITTIEKVYEALKLGLKDYVEKNKFPGVLLGLSGGIDSALTAAIAVDALGKERVKIMVLPSRFTSDLSMELLTKQIALLHLEPLTFSIEPTFTALLETLAPIIQNNPWNKTEENLQARCRGILLMALSNQTNYLLLTTGNKSEMAVGYATLYGDMCGGFNLLKDVYKTEVFELARYRNQLSPAIVPEIITRSPSAELKPNQADQDTLPSYEILDQILEAYIEHDEGVAEISKKGFEPTLVQHIIKMVNQNEYKRKQSCPGPRVTMRALTRERRYPITSKF